MKLTIILFIGFMYSAFGSGVAQTISVKGKDLSFRQVFTEIKKQTGYVVFGNKELIASPTKLVLSATNVPLRQFLDSLLSKEPFKYEIVGQTVFITRKSVEDIPKGGTQLRIEAAPPLSGRVLDSLGRPLAGATISIKGQTKTTVADENGRFTIDAKEGDMLVISYAGMETRSMRITQSILSNASFSISLSPAVSQLNEVEVISTGYQSLLRKRSPGTVEHIGQEILANRPATNLSAALDGIIAGMQAVQDADGNNTFIIRGISTLNSTNNQRAPLIVVDGFPLTSADFSTINPNDVQSVDVLKDAAATAVWGARATNGVIVVTTKRGGGSRGLSIEGSAFVRVAQRPKLDHIMTTGSSSQSIAYEKQAFASNFTGGTPYQGGVFPGDLTRPMTLAQELLYANKFHGLSEAAMNRSLDSLSQISNSDQINDYLLQNTLLQQYNVSLNANNNRAKTYASLLYEHNKASYVGNGYQKFNINFANEYNVNKFLTFNFNTFLQYTNTDNSGASLAEIRGLSPYETLVNEDGSYAANLQTYNRRMLTQLPLNKFPYSDLSYNLLREIENRHRQSKNYYARIQAGFVVKIIPGLTLDSKLQYERGGNETEDYYNDNTFYVRQMIDNFTAYNNTTKVVGVSLLPKGGINQTTTSNLSNYNVRSQLNFVRGIHRFDVNATIGGEISQARALGRTNPWQYGYNPATQTSVVPPYGYGSSVDNFTGSTITGASTNNLSGGNTSLTYGVDRFVSYFGASNITYNDKYTLTLNIRGDASNYITSIPSLRWSPFWSIGGNWDMKAEKFLENVNWLNDLHLRASYGSTGTADKRTSTEALLNVGTAPNVSTGTITATVSSYGNPYLRWERTYSTNLGVDFRMFKNKLSGSINVYEKKGKDITGSVTLPMVYGTTTQTFNAANLVNRGIEIQLGTKVELSKDFRYNTSVNYAYNWNQITKLYFPNQSNYSLTTGSAFVEGKPVGAFYTYNYAGVNTLGQPQIMGSNKLPQAMTGSVLYFMTDGLAGGYMNYAGTSVPPHTMGWRNTFTYRNFSLTAQITGTFGGSFLNPTFAYNTFVGGAKTIVSRFVEQPLAGGTDVVPFPSAADNGSGVGNWQYYSPYLTHSIESSSYIQLKELYLNYELSPSIFKRSGLRNVNVYVQARNLGMIWNDNNHNYNPDFLPGTNLPLATYTFGAKIGL